MSHPGNRQCLSRAASARRIAAGTTREVAQTSPLTTGVTEQSQAMRRAVSAGIGVCDHSISAAGARESCWMRAMRASIDRFSRTSSASRSANS